MKLKTTKKSIKSSYETILSIGYCNIDYLLKFKNPIAYSSNNEGWLCDYYDIDNICISTGYSPIGLKVDYDTQTKYNNLAMVIVCDYTIDYETRKTQVNELLKKFIIEVTTI